MLELETVKRYVSLSLFYWLWCKNNNNNIYLHLVGVGEPTAQRVWGHAKLRVYVQ